MSSSHNYSSLRHGSGPLAGYTRSATASRAGGLADRYLQNASRGADSFKYGNNYNTTPTRTSALKSRFENGTSIGSRKADDINIAPPEERPRPSIGGRYLQRVNSREGTNETSVTPARSSWRESVYGVQYTNKEATTSPTSKTPANLTETERRRAEREKQIQSDKIKQQMLEEEREERRLRQALRKATLEKDEAKIAEVDAEIRRLQLRRQDSKKREREAAESKPLSRRPSFKTREKMAEVTVGGREKQDEVATVPDIVQTAMSFTDFDDYFRKHLIGGKDKEQSWCTYQPDSETEDSATEMSVVYKTKIAKELFTAMPTDLQHLVVRAHKRPIRFAAIMEMCKTDKYGKEFSAESERNFRGYNDVATMMTDFGFDLNAAFFVWLFKDNSVLLVKISVIFENFLHRVRLRSFGHFPVPSLRSCRWQYHLPECQLYLSEARTSNLSLQDSD
ncbi:FH1:FH2 domain containing protein 3 [Echinococcus multilocularis]|uniref:FH1:FH2 domain containing protein 3 n=1 Tax=Echinococcus multilocularis TaxID=6211 RepID=A0A068Y3F8_ECHMU|nr:FH1:FH2 domain containing protein 3 [Echinococcus multilocularis]